jgi:hypothetical protein
MNRIIVDHKKLTPEILNLLVEKFPDGYGIRDIIKFTNHKGQYIEAVEVRSEDAIYLVKISDQLVDSMDNFDEDEDEDNDGSVDLIDAPDIEDVDLDED